MKVLILLFSVLAAAYAGYASGYHGPQHIPVIHNGVPIETPEVQHAKAAHYAALAEAEAKSGGYDNYEDHSYDNDGHYGGEYDGKYGYSVQHVTKNYQHHEYPAHHSVAHHTSYNHGPIIPAYETSHVLPKIGHDGKPLDTPEVELAKAEHFAAVHKALASTSKGYEHHYRRRRGIYDYHVPIISHEGVPVDTYEVQKAKAEHYAAVAAASHSSDSSYDNHVLHEPHYKPYYSYEVPQIGYDGKPLDTAEVEYKKAEHFAAHKEALERLHKAKYGYADSYGYDHQGPVDTPEVQHAKAIHFAAHAAAKSHHY